MFAVSELERWKNRHAALKSECKRLPHHERSMKRRQLSKINEQISYYRALTRDMKKRIKPPKLHHFFGLLTNY